MNTDIIKTFTPKNDDGGLDARFNKHLENIFKQVRPEVINGLNEFQEKTLSLENQYGGLAYELCMRFWDEINAISYEDRETTNKFNYKPKVLKKVLAEGLKEKGFKPTNVSKIIGASEFVYRLTEEDKRMPRFKADDKNVVLEFVQSLPISCQYIASCLSDKGIEKAISYEQDTKAWDSKTDTFIGKKISARALEEIKRSYPKDPSDGRVRKTSSLTPHITVLDDDPTPITEIVVERSKEDMSQIELVNELAQIVGLIDVSNIYKDKEIIERLSIVAKDLWSVAHLAQLPIPNK